MKHIGFCSMATLLVILVVAAGPAAAGEIYLLVAADTSQEGGIALSTGPDTGFIYDAFVANVPSDQLVSYGMERHRTWNADADAGSEGDRRPWKGPEITNDLADMGQKLLTAIDNCPAGPDDTILFFYSGHGAHDEDGHYLLMPDQKTTLSRQTVVQRIQRKNPRLAVVITDSCSNQLDRGLLPGPRMAIQPPEKISPLFAELFVNAEGLADFNSCTEDQIAAGPIGGGLMVVAMAYMGNKPEFHTAKNLGVSVEPGKSSRSDSISIPPVNYFRTIVEMHGGFEHGMMPNFDPDKPQYGVLWRYRDQKLSWSDFRKLVIKRTAELYESLPKSYKTHKGEYQATQTPQFYSLPKALSRAGVGLRIEPGDTIICVNGKPIRNTSMFWHAVKRSPRTMSFGVIDCRTGNTVYFKTQLRSGRGSRFGVVARDIPDEGVRITRIASGSPGSRAKVTGMASSISSDGLDN